MDDALVSGSGGQPPEYDVAVIGAGATGLYAVYRLRQLGLSVRGFEEGSGVGGTWYWCRYPGCRLDSESYTYGYSFSDELLREWDWSEMFAAQPENEAYFNYVADKFDLRSEIELDTRIVSARYDEATQRWTLQTSRGTTAVAEFVITAVGLLSAHYVPDFPGLDDFRGTWCHTGRWPDAGIALEGRRVGVVGTGATGIQLIAAIAPEVEHLTVFQRTPNYTAPLRNRKLDDTAQACIKDNYATIFERCATTTHGYVHHPDPRSALDVTPEERLANFEQLWAQPGFKKWLGSFRDVMTPGAANDAYTEFFRNKIRERVADPELAAKLVPTDHYFGAKRPPCETGYFEVFARDNVDLVDVRENPIERITARGIRAGGHDYELDVIVFATGYDAVTGPLMRMEIIGSGGRSIRDKYAAGPRTFLGVQTMGFPNLFMLNSASVGNFVRAAEPLVDWVSTCIGYLRENELSAMQPTPEAEQSWVDYIDEVSGRMLRTRDSSWNFGANIPGKPRVLTTPPDNALVMKSRREEQVQEGFPSFSFAPRASGDDARMARAASG